MRAAINFGCRRSQHRDSFDDRVDRASPFSLMRSQRKNGKARCTACLEQCWSMLKLVSFPGPGDSVFVTGAVFEPERC